MAMMSSGAEAFSQHFFDTLSTIKMSGHTQADKPLRCNLKLQRAGRDTGTKASSFLSPSPHTEQILTLELSGIRVTCISSSRWSSGSSGRGSAAARIALVQKRVRFARKPLIKAHWF
jgi:hypothetical protein